MFLLTVLFFSRNNGTKTEQCGIVSLFCFFIRNNVDGVSPSVFRCTSTPMETGPIDACVET